MKPAAIRREVQRLITALALQEWRVEVQCLPVATLDDDGRTADVTYDAESMGAVIRVAADRPEDAVRADLLHETLHLALADAGAALALLRKPCGEQAWNVAREAYSAAEERFVIRLTRCFGSGEG